MELLRRRDVIRKTLERWDCQYKGNEMVGLVSEGRRRSGAIRSELAGLNLEVCTPEEINAIIGNDSWTENECHECRKNYETLVFLGTVDWQTFKICKECLQKALAAITS